jgi:hypothetical protein
MPHFGPIPFDSNNLNKEFANYFYNLRKKKKKNFSIRSENIF